MGTTQVWGSLGGARPCVGVVLGGGCGPGRCGDVL